MGREIADAYRFQLASAMGRGAPEKRMLRYRKKSLRLWGRFCGRLTGLTFSGATRGKAQGQSPRRTRRSSRHALKEFAWGQMIGEIRPVRQKARTQKIPALQSRRFSWTPMCPAPRATTAPPESVLNYVTKLTEANMDREDRRDRHLGIEPVQKRNKKP